MHEKGHLMNHFLLAFLFLVASNTMHHIFESNTIPLVFDSFSTSCHDSSPRTISRARRFYSCERVL